MAIQIKRRPRSELETIAIQGGFLPGEPLLVTDTGNMAIATSPNSYQIQARGGVAFVATAPNDAALGADILWAGVEGQGYTPANGRFTAPVTGAYFFSANILLKFNATAADYSLSFAVNGSIIGAGSMFHPKPDATRYSPIGFSRMIVLSAGQYVTTRVTGNVGATTNPIYTADTSFHQFSGFLIG